MTVAVAGSDIIALARRVAELLLANGQTSQRSAEAVRQIMQLGGSDATVSVRWGEVTIRPRDKSSRNEVVLATPLGVDMRKVAATMDVVDRLSSGRMTGQAAMAALDATAALPPIAALRFILLAAAGAAALAVIFGESHPVPLILIAVSAGGGAALRRWLATQSHNPFAQPLGAALLAGLLAALVMRLPWGAASSLIALCPCMVLVPGPHLLNGTLDLARTQLPIGAARIGYASMSILMICTGLLLGLSLGGVSLPGSGPSVPVTLPLDVLAAGVAVSAYGTFFSMPWRMLPFPILIGMLAHALRWTLITLAGANVETGAFVACLAVGVLMTPIANRLHLPFAGCAFAAVVSLIPGVFLFRMAAALVTLVGLGDRADASLVSGAATDGMTAFLILIAMGFGLIVPKLILGSIGTPSVGHAPRQ